MIDYKVIEGDADKFREKLLALYAERQEAHDLALASVAASELSSPGFLMAERRISELTQEIAALIGQPPSGWMA